MGGLILKLRPHEQLLINGAVVENGDRKTRLRVHTEGAHILRLRNAMRPEEATTPLKQAYFIAQLAVTGDITRWDAEERMTETLSSPDIADKTLVSGLLRHVREGAFYQAMRLIAGAIEPAKADAEDPEKPA